MKRKGGLWILILLAAICILWRISREAFAQSGIIGVESNAGYTYSAININAGGAFDYLPNGDILAIDLSYSSLNKLYVFDANGDGYPSNIFVIDEFAVSTFGSIVKVSPDKTFAIVGTSGASNMLYRLDLSTYKLSNLIEVSGNYDLLFLDNDTILVSANSGGFDIAKPNEIYVIDVNAPNKMRAIAKIDNTPSGAIALGANGDVFYIKNTWVYPAPSKSFKLYRFKVDDIQDAIDNEKILTESDAQLISSLDGGADIAVDTFDNDKLYVSLYSGEIFIINSASGLSEVFAQVPNSMGSFVQLNFSNPQASFIPYVYSDNVLGVSLATNFFSTHEVIEFKTDTSQGLVDAYGMCVPSKKDCVSEPLEPRACVGANGFLGQVNIASVINLQSYKLPVLIEYYDISGNKVSAVSASVKPQAKSDFIINDMGLTSNTYGTVCVTADAPPHSWTGGITIYKPDTRVSGSEFSVFGDTAFDFALYYPFENPKRGRTTVPLNTYHIGMDARDPVANWISISDAEIDGTPIKGEIIYYSQTGEEVERHVVSIPDGGRRDFAGHLGLTNYKNIDAVGMAEFVPSNELDADNISYYLTVTRYFYDCGGVVCDNLFSAFAIPNRPGTSALVAGNVTTKDGAFSVVELNNTSANFTAVAEISVNSKNGASVGSSRVKIPNRATRHIIINKNESTGFIEHDQIGTALTESISGKVSAITFTYELSLDGKLMKAYAAPLVGAFGKKQISQFNSYINHTNILNINNVGSRDANVDIRFIDVFGAVIYERSLKLGSYSAEQLDNLLIPSNTFGSIVLESDVDTLIMRNNLTRTQEYTLTFTGQ